MQHADPDQLALVALGEPLEDGAAEVTGHLRQCGQCRQEVDALRRTVDLARETVEYRTEDAGPPDRVWSRIAAELDLPATPSTGRGAADFGRRGQGAGPSTVGPDGFGRYEEGAGPSAVGPDGFGRHDERVGPSAGRPGGFGWGDGGRAPGGSFAGGPGGSAPVPRAGDEFGPGVRAVGGRGARRPGGRRPAGRHSAGGRSWTRAAGALVAAVAVGVVGTLVAVRPWQDDPAGTVVAGSTASLAPVAGGPGSVSGRAVVVQGTGGPQLDVTTAGLPAQQGYYEVWVFDGDRSMVSVGVLGANSTAALTLPPTLDLRRYHVVDISQEQYDGNQNHSTVSVLRGTLTD